MRLGDLKIGMRLGLGFGLLFIMLLAVGGFGYRGVSTVSEQAISLLLGDAQVAEHSEAVRADLNKLRRFEKDLFLNIGVKEKEDSYLKKWNETFNTLKKNFAELEKATTSRNDKETVDAMNKNLTRYESGINKVYGMIRDGKIKTPQEGNAAMQEFKEETHAFEQDANRLSDESGKKIDKAEPIFRSMARRTTTTLFILILVSIVLTVGTSIVITFSITRPLYKAVEVSNTLAKGDLTVHIDASAKDETGQLLLAMKKMAENLGGVIRNITGASNQIASSSEELSATAEEMAKGMDMQTSQTSQVASAMEEMSATVLQVAKNAQGAASSAKEATATAQKGGDVVAKTVKGMQRIADTVQESARTIGELGKSSDQIGEIVAVIDDIADQTNLLALNAAIEAARAGEQGRGFAVVADEVRKLAERTTKATKEIAAMIKNIQKETDGAVSVMEAGTKEVADGVKLANEAGQALNMIVEAVDKVNDMIAQIATASEEQSAAAEEISNSIEGIASITKETAEGSRQTSTASYELSRMATELRGMVGQFKI